MSQLFTSSGQSTGASTSASVLPMNIQGWFPLGLTGLISLQSKGLSSVFSRTTVRKHQLFGAQASLWSNSHICTWPVEKSYLWLYGPLSANNVFAFNVLPRFFITFLPRSKHLLNFMAAVTIHSDFEAQENKICHCFHFLPFLLPCDEATSHDLSFLNAEFQASFFTCI